MELTKKTKILAIVAILFICSCYSFFVETDIYQISYPKEDSWNIDFIHVYHRKCSKKFVISNPPKDKFELMEFLIENLPKLINEYDDSSICGFEFYEEKWYLNRFFTTLYLDDQTIPDAIQNKYGKKALNDFVMENIGIKDNNPNFSFGVGISPYLIYYPYGYSRNDKNHWFLRFWHYTKKGEIENLIPASYVLADSLKTKENEGRLQDLVIPQELLKFKNKWPLIYRQ